MEIELREVNENEKIGIPGSQKIFDRGHAFENTGQFGKDLGNSHHRQCRSICQKMNACVTELLPADT